MLLRRTHLVLALVAALAAPVAAPADTTYTFTGHGYGHGVGMGQYGAQGYALQGWTHQQILAHYYQGTTLGPGGVSQVRVLLQETLPAASASSPSGITASDEGGTATVASPGAGVVTVRKDADGFTVLDAAGAELARGWAGPVALAATDGSPVTLVGAALNSVRDGRYRGRLRVLAGTSGVTVVNVLSLESYLRGVVAREMPSTWQPEALQAQAVAARTYAIATRKAATSPYDLFPDERSQVYGGISAEVATSSAAVDATAGEVVLYQGKPIVTYFSSSSGGRTANAGEVFADAAPVPYLTSVDDPFDTLSPYHDWTLSLDDRALAAEGRVSRPRDGRARRLVPVGARAGGHDQRQRRAARAGLRARAQALRAALDVVRRDSHDARAGDREGLAERPGRPQPRAPRRHRAAWRGDAPGPRPGRLARPRDAPRRRERRGRLPAPRRRGESLPARGRDRS